jgi:predicted dithiol-disulfide oxidoreductase (DUF899 family)
MTMQHQVVSHEDWIEARRALLKQEKALTRHRDLVAAERLRLPWVRIDKDYVFGGPERKLTLSDLFQGRSQLYIKHFMMGLGAPHQCVGCSLEVDHMTDLLPHLENHDVSYAVVARAPIDEVEVVRKRMGWKFLWVSSSDSDFNYDFNVSITEEQQSGAIEYNYRQGNVSSRTNDIAANEAAAEARAKFAAGTGTDWATYGRQTPGMSAFALEDGVVYHTYSTYARGLDGLWSMQQWLDRAPRGRNEAGPWWRRHDEYDKE